MKLILAIRNFHYIIILGLSVIRKRNDKIEYQNCPTLSRVSSNGMLQLVTYILLRANRYMSCFFICL